jgi:hypothetical protein
VGCTNLGGPVERERVVAPEQQSFVPASLPRVCISLRASGAYAFARFRLGHAAQQDPLTTTEPARTAPRAAVPGPDAVRYMSVDSREQPDSEGRSRTRTRKSNSP